VPMNELMNRHRDWNWLRSYIRTGDKAHRYSTIDRAQDEMIVQQKIFNTVLVVHGFCFVVVAFFRIR
jgi:hypothetical protein